MQRNEDLSLTLKTTIRSIKICSYMKLQKYFALCWFIKLVFFSIISITKSNYSRHYFICCCIALKFKKIDLYKYFVLKRQLLSVIFQNVFQLSVHWYCNTHFSIPSIWFLITCQPIRKYESILFRSCVQIHYLLYESYNTCRWLCYWFDIFCYFDFYQQRNKQK